jgi:CBS domain-containing protein
MINPTDSAISDPMMYGLAFGLFVVILIILVLIRTESWKKNGFQNADIVLALIPIVFLLLMTGKLQKFSFGGMSFETVFAEAAQSGIEDQIKSLGTIESSIITTSARERRSIDLIPELIENKTEGLVFKMGKGSYEGVTIKSYFKRLLAYPHLKYVLVEDHDGRFLGMFDAREIGSDMLGRSPRLEAGQFAEMVNGDSLDVVRELPGFQAADKALTSDADKLTVLEILDERNVNELPVVDDNGHFIGMIDRSRLTASLMINMARQIK